MVSLIQTAEGALNETQEILQRMRELAVQSSNDTNTETDRAELQKEADQLAEELTRISDNTEFNTQNLLGGEFSATFHIGANSDQSLKIDINAMGAKALGVEGKLEEDTEATVKVGNIEVENQTVLKNGDSVVAVQVEGEFYALSDLEVKNTAADGDDPEYELSFKEGAKALELEGGQSYGSIDISSQEAADKAITSFQTAIDSVSSERSKLGAVQNRLEHTINNLGASSENLTAAESRIRDVDYTEAA